MKKMIFIMGTRVKRIHDSLVCNSKFMNQFLLSLESIDALRYCRFVTVPVALSARRRQLAVLAGNTLQNNGFDLEGLLHFPKCHVIIGHGYSPVRASITFSRMYSGAGIAVLVDLSETDYVALALTLEGCDIFELDKLTKEEASQIVAPRDSYVVRLP